MHKTGIGKKTGDSAAEAERTRACRVFTPEVDILESPDRITLTVDMPGVDEKSLDITLEKNVLSIYGTVDPEIPEKFRAAAGEYCIGDYERKFTISREIDGDNIRASVKDGVLRLTLPKIDQAKARKISVSSS